MEINSKSTRDKQRVRILLATGEVVEPGTLLRLGGNGCFIKAETEEYNALHFMAWPCEKADLRGEPSRPIWAEILTSDEAAY